MSGIHEWRGLEESRTDHMSNIFTPLTALNIVAVTVVQRVDYFFWKTSRATETAVTALRQPE
jgi:hypothetical protein